MTTQADSNNDQQEQAFLDEYNKELDESEAEIDEGNYLTHDEVKKMLDLRRKK